jgi:hypothetical protein
MMVDVRAGLREYRWRSATAGLAGLVVLIVGVQLVDEIGVGDDLLSRLVERLLVLIVVFGGGGFLAGVLGLARVARIRRLGSRHGWRKRMARFRVQDGPGKVIAALLLLEDDLEPEAVLGVSTTVWRVRPFDGTEWLWVAGQPLSRFAAVATPDGAHVIVVRRPILRRERERLREIATGA